MSLRHHAAKRNHAKHRAVRHRVVKRRKPKLRHLAKKHVNKKAKRTPAKVKSRVKRPTHRASKRTKHAGAHQRQVHHRARR